MKIVDLSRELYHKTPTYPGHPPIVHGVWTTHEESYAASGNVHGLVALTESPVASAASDHHITDRSSLSTAELERV
ncbi:hypothetical protein [Bradyrhizobium erythrophlei]|uniref:hypothetical protein n=1 Tax=Bradyrhizobium erythrophlei TaxID=1437360 RepID=UPI0009A91341|nr:hypothetical protein [Bradyrhizobium erythrophlei]